MNQLSIHQVVADIQNQSAGPSYSVTGLCKALDELGAAVKLHTLEPAPDVTFPFPVAYYPKWRFPARLGVSPVMSRALYQVAMDSEVIHFNGLWMMPSVYPGRAVEDTSCSLVVSPRGMLDPWAINWSKWRKSVFWHLLQGRVVRQVDCIHVTSDQELEAVRRLGLRQAVAVVPIGIDIPEVFQQQTPNNERVLLYLGRLHPKKNIEALLEAWSQIHQRFGDWVLWIVGPGDPSYIRRLQELGMSLGVQRVKYVGPAYGSDKVAAYRAADLFVLPTHSENFGITIAEALSFGVPVITTKGAPWQGLETYGCGWWVEIGPDALVEAFSESMDLSRSELREMGVRGRRWMVSDFSWSNAGRMMLETYQWLRDGGPAPPWVDRT